ncbi:MAG: hypothetical protein IT493_04170 [Gammaproteobacteria bacterium]|nr:hypothetical protein [Gammaproteobacteria bacterium]
MSSPVRLVITPYLNTRAFVHHGAPPGGELVALPPRAAGPAIAAGEALAGIVPVAALEEFDDSLELLGDYGIACAGAARSVLLFSRRPFERLDADARLRLTRESRSSVRLLYLLLAARGAGMPRHAGPQDAIDGELVIGDAALRRAGQPSKTLPHVADLAERWRATTGLPMVFARWVVRRDAPAAWRARLLDWLAAYARDEPRLLARAAACDGARAGLDRANAGAYLDGIRTVLGPDELRGQQRYLAELARHAGADFAPARAAPLPAPAGRDGGCHVA